MFNPKRQVNSVIITSADIGREYDEYVYLKPYVRSVNVTGPMV